MGERCPTVSSLQSAIISSAEAIALSKTSYGDYLTKRIFSQITAKLPTPEAIPMNETQVLALAPVQHLSSTSKALYVLPERGQC
jgi:hypothetical protein